LVSNGLSINTYNLLDAPTEAHSWLGVRQSWNRIPRPQSTRGEIDDTNDYFTQNTQISNKTFDSQLPATIETALRLACEAVLGIENELTEYDTVAGDGDCGHTFAAGAGGEYIHSY
jgi:dihydroxyacetone kinase